MARARKVSGVNGNATFGEAAAAAVEVRSQEVFAFGDRVLDMSDPDGVHDMRVATRRLRAALEIFAPCFPKGEHRALLREVRVLADALGGRRDPDVQIEALEKLRAELGQGDRTGVNGLLAELRGRQQLRNERLEEALDRAREAHLDERLAALAQKAGAE